MKKHSRTRTILKVLGYTGLIAFFGFPFYYVAFFLLGMLGLGQ